MSQPHDYRDALEQRIRMLEEEQHEAFRVLAEHCRAAGRPLTKAKWGILCTASPTAVILDEILGWLRTEIVVCRPADREVRESQVIAERIWRLEGENSKLRNELQEATARTTLAELSALTEELGPVFDTPSVTILDSLYETQV